ncbi:kinase-like protein [Schizopora paradoxa]|uniref:Kinase-like protein n=1 Tax=Schizopora paradoxa TaxID=27342 RepID=A0A0H2RE10_9AGAM|nr:kinase-like protein [Schizopora paradoxa]
MALRIFTTRPRSSDEKPDSEKTRKWKTLWKRHGKGIVVEQQERWFSDVVEAQDYFNSDGSATLRKSEGNTNDDVKSISSSFIHSLRHRWSNLSSSPRLKVRSSQDRLLSKKRSQVDGISQVQRQGFSSCPCNKQSDHHPEVLMKSDFRGTPKLIFNFLFPNSSSFVRFFVNENPHVLGRRDSNWTQDEEARVPERTSSYVQLLSESAGPKAVMCHTRDIILHETLDYIVVSTSKRMFDTTGNFTMTIAMKTCITWASPTSASVLVTMRQKQFDANGLDAWPTTCSKSEIDCYREIERALHVGCARELGDADFVMNSTSHQCQIGSSSSRRHTFLDASPLVTEHLRLPNRGSVDIESRRRRSERPSMDVVVEDRRVSDDLQTPRRVAEDGVVEELVNNTIEPRRSLESTTESSSLADFQTVLARWAHLDLGQSVRALSANPIAHGGYADVFMGYSTKHEKKVAIKRIRIHLPGKGRFAKKVVKEIRIWSKLQHPNVHPLLEYVIDGDRPSFISEWMENGSLRGYMIKLTLNETLKMVHGIARGLAYLHFHGVIHSDLKADNVLVSLSGEALLTDFGISSIIESTLTFELGSNKFQRHTAESDVWAFGMTVYELLTHESPYFHIKIEAQVILAIAKGARPTQPASPWFQSLEPFGTFLWLICQNCWFKDPTKRLKMLDAIRELDSVAFSDSKHPIMLDRLRDALAVDDIIAGDSSGRRGTEIFEEGSQELADWLFYSSSY